jgi:hypothetical protein
VKALHQANSDDSGPFAGQVRPVLWFTDLRQVNVSTMPLAGLAWQTLPETGALALVDMTSRRAAAVARPHPADLAMADIVEVERLVLAWSQPASWSQAASSQAASSQVASSQAVASQAVASSQAAMRAEAEAALDARLAVAPLDTLRAVCWLLGMWIVTLHVQTGQSPHVLVQAVQARPSWDHLDLPQTHRLWDALTDRVRTGVLAALTGDPATVSAFAVVATVPPAMPEILLRHALTVAAAVYEDMLARGLDPSDMASTIALYTTDPDVAPTSYFRPLE